MTRSLSNYFLRNAGTDNIPIMSDYHCMKRVTLFLITAYTRALLDIGNRECVSTHSSFSISGSALVEVLYLV